MKTSIVLSIVALFLTSKASADCWSERLGWPCCSDSNAEVIYVDDDGDWGVENNDWCGIQKEEENNNSWDMGDWNQGGNQGGGMPWGDFGGNQGGGMQWGDFGGNQGGGMPWGDFGGNQGGGMPWGDFGGNQGGNQGGGMPWGDFGGNQGGNQGGGMPWGDFGGNQGGGMQWGDFGGNQGGNQGGGMPWGDFGGNQGGGMQWGDFGGNQGGNQGGGMPWGDFGGNQGGGMQWGDFGGNQGGGMQWGDFGGNQGGNQDWGNQGGNSGPTVEYSTDVDCSGKTLKSNTNLNINGRKVIVKFPSGFTGDKAAPLLINYHPIMGSASQWESGSQTAKAALNDGAIVAFMDGAQGPMGQAWNVGPCCTDADDVQFTRNFIKEITSKACVDPKRIYAAGFSMGGGMSNYAGCQLADVIAAAAPSAFDLAKEIVDGGKCKPARPFPILNFRGTQDNVVMYNGGLSQVVQGKPITFMGAKNNFKEWAKMNGCTGEPKQNTPGNNCEMYENCKGGVKVGLCTINGGGHAEGDGKMGWDFVKQFSLP